MWNSRVWLSNSFKRRWYFKTLCIGTAKRSLSLKRPSLAANSQAKTASLTQSSLAQSESRRIWAAKQEKTGLKICTKCPLGPISGLPLGPLTFTPEKKKGFLLLSYFSSLSNVVSCKKALFLQVLTFPGLEAFLSLSLLPMLDKVLESLCFLFFLRLLLF